jgi:hypothetical protein
LPYSLTEAATATGHNRATIWKAIKRGALSASRDAASGQWRIDPAELHRVFPATLPTVATTTPSNGEATAEAMAIVEATATAVLQAKLDAEQSKVAMLERVNEDLRHQLGEERADRRQAQEQLGEALRQIRALTDQRTAASASPLAARAAGAEPAPNPARRSWWRWKRA